MRGGGQREEEGREAFPQTPQRGGPGEAEKNTNSPWHKGRQKPYGGFAVPRMVLLISPHASHRVN